MLGLIQIAILLGCIHLAMKAIEVSQIGLAAQPENRKKAHFYTVAAVLLGLGGAAFCFWLMMDQTMALSDMNGSYWGS